MNPYPEAVIEKEIKKLRFSEKVKNLKQYKPSNWHIWYIIDESLLLYLFTCQKCFSFFSGPIVLFRTASKISNYLVKAKLYPLLGTGGSKKSEVLKLSRCEVCLNIEENDTFASIATGESFKINHKLNGDDNCPIDLLTCKCCGKQYVEETTDEFRLRWKYYKSNDRENTWNEVCMQEQLFEHFNVVIVVFLERFP